jgi:hypothetical protein
MTERQIVPPNLIVYGFQVRAARRSDYSGWPKVGWLRRSLDRFARRLHPWPQLTLKMPGRTRTSFSG